MSDALFKTRIYHESSYQQANEEDKKLIQYYLNRPLIYNERLKDILERQGLCSLDVGSATSVEELSNKCLELLDTKID